MKYLIKDQKGRTELNLLQIVNDVKSNLKLVFLSSIGVSIIIIIISFTWQDEYTSSVKLIVEEQSASKPSDILGDFGGLASIIGVDINSSSNLSSALIPDLILTNELAISVLQREIDFPVEGKMRLIDYYKNYYKKPLFDQLVSFAYKIKSLILPKKDIEYTIENKNIRTISLEDAYYHEDFKSRIVFVLNENGLIQLTFYFDNQFVSAQILEILTDEIKSFIINNKTFKQKENLMFLEKNYFDFKEQYLNSLNALSKFNENNRYIASSFVETERKLLEQDINFKFQLYSTASSQYEEAKVLLQKETPVFSLLEPIKVPLEKSFPKRISLIFTSLIGSFFFIYALILMRLFYIEVKRSYFSE